MWGCCPEHFGYVDVVLYVVCQLDALQPLACCAVDFVVGMVERVAELFEQHDGVGIYARMLSGRHYVGEYAVDVGHVEVAAQQQVA